MHFFLAEGFRLVHVKLAFRQCDQSLKLPFWQCNRSLYRPVILLARRLTLGLVRSGASCVSLVFRMMFAYSGGLFIDICPHDLLGKHLGSADH